MSTSTIPSKDHGPWLLDGHPARISLTMSHARSTKNFTLQRILVTHGNTLRAMSLTSHGEQPPSQPSCQATRTLSQESLLLTIQS